MEYRRKARNIFGWIIANIILSIKDLEKIIKQYEFNNIFPFFLHNPGKKHFEKIIRWLLDHNFHFISVKELFEILDKRKTCPHRAVWLSFDDGWKENIENVIPVLERFKVPATIFVSTEPIDSGYFWFSIARKNYKYFDLEIKKFWDLPDSERKVRIDKFKNKFKLDYNREAMSREEIKMISSNPLVTLGNHTNNHAILTNCTDEEIKFEVEEANTKLKDITNLEVDIFAYPNGNYNKKVIDVISQTKINLAATIEPFFINLNKEQDRYKIPRILIMDDGSLKENLCHMFGLWQPTIKKIKRVFSIRKGIKKNGQ